MHIRAIDLARSLSYQNSAGVHTMGHCSNKGCRKTARGSAHCGDCVEGKLAKIIGEDAAHDLHELYHKRMVVQDKIDTMVGEM